jgi:hypothetical protein
MQVQSCLDSGVYGGVGPTKSPQIDLGELSDYDVNHIYQECARSSVG